MLLFYFHKSRRLRKARIMRIIQTQATLQTLWLHVTAQITRRINEIRLKWGVFRIIHGFKASLRKRLTAYDIQGRNCKRMQLLFNAAVAHIYDPLSDRSHCIILAVMREAHWKNTLALAFDKHIGKLNSVCRRVRRQISYQEARYRALAAYSQKELDHYAVKLSQSKKPEENFLGTHFEQFFNYEYGEKLLRLYLSRCKLLQSLIFLQYRSKIADQPINHLVKLFYERQDYMISLFTKIQTLWAE